MKRWCIPIITFIALLTATGLLITLTGIVPVRASSGHWEITRWLLNFSKARSVSTHSAGIDAPTDLNDPSRVMKGAGHFETGCAFCHGSPVWHTPRIAQQLTPTPPHLPDRVPRRSPEELFYLIKHGVKFTGMPAFPSQQRDDEVWDVVAFLIALPELDATGYRKLISGDESRESAPDDAPHAVVESCARCHGFDGRGRDSEAFPHLASLHQEYFIATMNAYADGDRHSGMMEPVAARLTADEIQQVAEYYSSRRSIESRNTVRSSNEALSAEDKTAESSSESQPEKDTSNKASLQNGETIAAQGLPDQNIGACVACHPASREEHNPAYPVLAGQPARYLVSQLKLFQQRRRGGTESASLMHAIVDKLKPDQMRDVAAFYSSLPDESASSEDHAIR